MRGIRHADPFPHLVATEFFDPELLAAVRDEVPDPDTDGWLRYGNGHERKLEGPSVMWGPRTIDYFAELESRSDDLAALFGLPPLEMETVGGGYHLIPPGGYLDVHTDFSRSPSTNRYRRLNVLTFLNSRWAPDQGGHLELWDEHRCKTSIAPEFGTTVAFVTSSTSWHGHPAPTTRWRASVAAYFFTTEPPDGYVAQSTVWHPNGGRG